MILVLKKDCKVIFFDTEKIDSSNLSALNKTAMVEGYYVVGAVENKSMNLGFIRQFLGELPPDKTLTAKELWDVFETFAPMMDEETEKRLVEELKSLVNKPIPEFPDKA